MYLKFSSSQNFSLFLSETIFTAVEALRFRFPDKRNLDSERFTATLGAQARCFLTNRNTFIMGGIGQPRTVLFYCKVIISGYMSQWYFLWYAWQSTSFGIFLLVYCHMTRLYTTVQTVPSLPSSFLQLRTCIYLPYIFFIFLTFCSLEKRVFVFVLKPFLYFCMNFLADSIMWCWR